MINKFLLFPPYFSTLYQIGMGILARDTTRGLIFNLDKVRKLKEKNQLCMFENEINECWREIRQSTQK